MRLEVLEAVSYPDRVIARNYGALMAVRETTPGKHLIVVYSESENDGFIITAFLTRRVNSLNLTTPIWPRLQ
jgi:hypothetical protein